MSVEPGRTARIQRVVTAEHTAIAVGSGDVAVLSSPTVLAWAEAACVAAVAADLGDGETTVGARFQLDHVHPAPVGAEVHVTADLQLVEGRRLTFAVEATTARATIASGRVVRVLVERARFLERSVE